MTGFAPVAGRRELESAMRNRFYNNVSRPGSYGPVPARAGVITASMTPLGRGQGRGVRGLGGGLGDLCDDTGAAVAVGIIGAAARIGGSLATEASRSHTTTLTSPEGGEVKSGGSREGATAGTLLTGAGSMVTDVWAASCLAASRGSATGTTPSESMDSVLARARATWAATAEHDRDGDVLYEREAAERREEREAAQAQSNRNLYIALGVGAVLVVGGVVLLRR